MLTLAEIRAAGVLALTFLGFLLAGCRDDDPVPAAAAESTAAGEPVVRPVDQLALARLDLAGGPDWLAVDDRGVWVKHDSGELTLVDPTSHAPIDSVDLGGPLCQGLGASYDAVWSCSGSDVVKLDPQSLEVEAAFDLQRQAQQGHLVGAFERVWILTGDGSHLIGVDPAVDDVALEVDLPAVCSDVAAGEAGLWLPCRFDNRVLQLDPVTGKVLQDLEIGNPVGIAVDDEVWVATATSTLRIDPVSGETLAEVAVGAEPDGSVTADEESIWVRSGDDFLVRIDRKTQVPTLQVTADVTSGGDVLVVDGLLWTTAFDDNALFVLDPGLVSDP